MFLVVAERARVKWKCLVIRSRFGESACSLSIPVLQCRFPQISHPALLTRDSAEASSTHRETINNHGQGLFLSLQSSVVISSCKSQADGMEIIEEKPNDPHNPPMETEEIVSVLDRKFPTGPHPPCPLGIAHLLPHTLEEAFAAKHMPDLGHDVKEFQVFHWKLQGWKKLDKKLTSPEFECGGHKWCVLTVHRPLDPLRNLRIHSGGYFSSRSEILTPLLTIPSLSILTTPTPRA